MERQIHVNIIKTLADFDETLHSRAHTHTHTHTHTIIVKTKCVKLFGLYLATPGNDAVKTPMYSESDENQLDYDADDEVSNSSSSVSGITDLGCEDENQDTTGDY